MAAQNELTGWLCWGLHSGLCFIRARKVHRHSVDLVLNVINGRSIVQKSSRLLKAGIITACGMPLCVPLPPANCLALPRQAAPSHHLLRTLTPLLPVLSSLPTIRWLIASLLALPTQVGWLSAFGRALWVSWVSQPSLFRMCFCDYLLAIPALKTTSQS